jgi:hypothetical protein
VATSGSVWSRERTTDSSRDPVKSSQSMRYAFDMTLLSI